MFSFGMVNSLYTLTRNGSEHAGSLLSNVLLVNLPQLLISVVYISFSGLVTSIFVSREYARHSKHRKGLRVTDPHGAQRSTSYLNVPYWLSTPLTGTMALLHWVLSESIFLARVSALKGHGEPDHSNDISSCGWSPAAVGVSLAIGSVLLFSISIAGFKGFTSHIPIASTCSAAISAAYHRSAHDEADVAERPLMYGKMRDMSDVGTHRVGFSARSVRRIMYGEEYGEVTQLKQLPQRGPRQKEADINRWAKRALGTTRFSAPLQEFQRRQQGFQQLPETGSEDLEVTKPFERLSNLTDTVPLEQLDAITSSNAKVLQINTKEEMRADSYQWSQELQIYIDTVNEN